MSTTGACTIGIIGLALGLSAAGKAADAGTDWAQLQQLHPGDKVRVALRGKLGVTADFGAVTPDGLQLFAAGRNRLISRGRRSSGCTRE